VRSDRWRLEHILEAINSLESFIAPGKPEFLHNEMMQSACVRQLEIIGEATRHLSSELKDRRPDVPWPDIIRMRNRMIHQYFGVNIRRVWTIATKDIPSYREVVEELLAMEDVI
jgi:uncharacterized protein with HEPN domain